jgi:hypothetical protein
LSLINRGCDTSAFEKWPIPAAEVFQLGSGKVFLFAFVGIAVSRRVHQTNASVSSALPGSSLDMWIASQFNGSLGAAPLRAFPAMLTASDVVMSSLTDIQADEVELMLGQR